MGVTVALTLVALVTFGGVGFWIFRKKPESDAQEPADRDAAAGKEGLVEIEVDPTSEKL